MRTQLGKQIRDSDICVLCTQEPATTKEHIPPQAVFSINPTEYLLVPACSTCNDSTKLDDEYFRQTLSMSSSTEEGLRVWKERVLPKLEERPATKAGLREQLGPVEAVRKGLGRLVRPGIWADAQRLNRVLKKMIWGLYWWHEGELLVPSVPLEIFFLNVAQVPEYFSDPYSLEIYRKTTPGIYREATVIRTFYYTYVINDQLSAWYLFFYRQNAFIVLTDFSRVSESREGTGQTP